MTHRQQQRVAPPARVPGGPEGDGGGDGRNDDGGLAALPSAPRRLARQESLIVVGKESLQAAKLALALLINRMAAMVKN